MTVTDGARWFAANTRPNVERVAIANLTRQGFRSFMPLRMKTVRHARHFRTSVAPLFPGYLFVHLDLARDRWRSVNGTYGVVSLVAAGLEPLAVPPGVVETMIALSTEQGVISFNRDLRSGQQVKILAGPFAEQFGTLERLDDCGRVQVLLEMMGTFVRVVSTARALAPA